LGLSSGQIQLVNPANSAIITTLSHPSSSSPISSLSFPTLPQDLLSRASISLLWSCGADGQIRLWALPDSAGSGSHLIATHPGGGAGWSTLAVAYPSVPSHKYGSAASAAVESRTSLKAEILVAQHAIKCYTIDLPLSYLSSQSHSTSALEATLSATFTGHTSKVRQLSWLQPSKGGMRFLSVAEGDRYVNNWAAGPESVSVEGRLQATLCLDEAVAQVVMSPRRDAALAVTTSGFADLFLFWPETQTSPAVSPAGGRKKAKVPVASLQRTTSIICPTASKDMITTARFLRADASIIRVSRGIVRPSFESIVSELLQGRFNAFSMHYVQLPRNADGTFRPEVSTSRNPDSAPSTQVLDSRVILFFTGPLSLSLTLCVLDWQACDLF
jgi:U3 small nucleolar RNA-associated protein 5